MEGSTHHAMDNAAPGQYLPNGNPGPYGGGTIGPTDTTALQADYENVFGPAARDIKFDPQRQKRHQRWHLPDALKGANFFLTDRVDGLITDTTYSPFTSYILPYVYLEHPDAKIKWNVWSFDEGLPSRAPYESGARVLTQTKKSYAGYTVRHAIGIRMEHNFMRSQDGIVNFQRQLKQLVGSIQNGNDLDVMMALVQAPSYAQQVAEKYYAAKRNATQLVRAYVDLFGIMQKSPVGLDVLIEECKQELKNWGAEEPSFMLVNSKFTMQLQMTPERTSYVTQGIDGVKRLRQGPDIDSYRGLSLIKSRAFTIETGALPRDVLRRRVRVAEYYRIRPDQFADTYQYEFYDQSKDSWFRISGDKLKKLAYPDTASQKYPGRAPYIDAKPMISSVSLDPGHTTYTLDDWTYKPYNAKTSMLASLSNTVIQSGVNSHALVLPTYYVADEKIFAQTITQGANVMETGQHPQAHVDASAWFGGGIFCDTTYHLKEGHRAAFPLCNWASLDASRAMKDGALGTDETLYCVKYNTADILNAAPEDLKIYVAYRPNAFKFTWENAHNNQNCNLTTENAIVAAFATAQIDEAANRSLWSHVPGVSQKAICEMYRLMVPMVAYGTTDDQIMSQINAIPVTRNPWTTVLMVGLGAHFHPNSDVRSELQTKLNDAYPSHSNGLENYVKSYMGYAPEITARQATDLFNQFSTINNVRAAINTDTNWIDTTIAYPDNKVSVKISDTKPITPELCSSLFFLTTAKRYFCAAGRFDDGGNHELTKKAGLSLLSRSYAVLTDNVSGLGGPLVPPGGGSGVVATPANKTEIVLIRPNIEHNMLGMIIGRGGIEELGATFWGQTELNCFDDAEHGLWGMNYKYHERAQVMNEKNMVRLWDVCFDGYNGGMDDTFIRWDSQDSVTKFIQDTNNLNEPYNGDSFIAMGFEVNTSEPNYQQNWPSPILWCDHVKNATCVASSADPENIHKVVDPKMRVFRNLQYADPYLDYMGKLPDFAGNARLSKPAGTASAVDEATHATAMAFQGQMRIYDASGNQIADIQGAGHLGPSYPGVASVREGKGMRPGGNPTFSRLV